MTMNALKIIGFIGAAILIFFGVLFIWGSSSAQGGGSSWVVIGLISVAIGFIIIYFSARARPAGTNQNITYNIDLPGNVKLDSLKCQSCGGVLSSKDITMVAGAPVVNCPYCHTTYQLTEAPKW
jgi:hypothetical protein